jgi:hypothetical protein
VGVWIDHKKAVIVSIAAGHVATRTLESDVEAHPHFSGSQEGGGEKKYEERHHLHLDHYYDEIISKIGQPDALLLFGPGEAKLQLQDRLGRSHVSSQCNVAVETTDKLTDPQIVAKVKEHYGIAR